MNLFQMKSDLNGSSRMSEFLKENFVCFGWPGIGDLENVSQDELMVKLSQHYSGDEYELAEHIEEMITFVYVMQDGDYLLIADEDNVYLGDLGDYYYIEDFAAAEESMCHRRGVTWLKSLPREELHEELQRFLDYQGAIAKFERAVTSEQMERWMSLSAANAQETGESTKVDAKTVEEALEILKAAMRSDDMDRRERAAIAILQYSK